MKFVYTNQYYNRIVFFLGLLVSVVWESVIISISDQLQGAAGLDAISWE